MPEIEIYEGDIHTDKRGAISFVNDFTFRDVKRFYNITHPDTGVIRAWQGHRIEHKYFFVPAGRFVVAWVLINDWSNPSPDLQSSYTILAANEPRILHIPPGYANGIKAITAFSVLTIYSDLSLSESENDRWSFNQSLWLDWTVF